VVDNNRRTTLTEYFATNQACQDDIDHGRPVGLNCLDILYQDFPSAFVWHTATKKWTIRKREIGTIGRVAFVSPRQPERFFLRLLIVTFAGFKSFEDVRTYDGAVYRTYREACLARGILADDHEWHHALSEAAGVDSGRALRGLFFYIIFNCNPSDPSELWRTHKDALSDDCRYRLTRLPHNITDATDSQAHSYALCELRRTLQSYGKDLIDYGLPEPQFDYIADLSSETNRMIRDELIYDREDLADTLQRDVPILNVDQRKAYDVLTAAVTSGGQRQRLLPRRPRWNGKDLCAERRTSKGASRRRGRASCCYHWDCRNTAHWRPNGSYTVWNSYRSACGLCLQRQKAVTPC